MTSLDDINAQLLTLKTELRKTENTRDDMLKAADDPTAQIPREEYLAYAAGLEGDAADLRVKIADLEAQRRLLRDR
ncbi:hypothetical protein ACVWZM_005253 [Bradyrhizobium sp. USDA 4501]